MPRIDPPSERYRSRLFRRHLWMAFIPATFFIALGIVAISLSQGFVGRELRALSDKNLRRVRDSVELLFGEADALALGLSTDPEFARTVKEGLRARFATLADVKSYRAVQSSLASSVNSRPFLHSILVSMANPEGLVLSSAEGFIQPEDSQDPDWLAGAAGKEGELSLWTEVRRVAPFRALELRVGVLSLYRNLLGGAGLLEREGVLCVNIGLGYLNRFLEDQSSGTGGSFVLVDRSSGRMLAGDARYGGEARALLELFPEGAGAAPKVFRSGGEAFAVSSLASERLPFSYFLLSPRAAFDRIPRAIGAIAAAFALVSLVAGAALTLASARSNFRLLEGIMDIIEAAGTGAPLPHLKESRDEALNYVTFSVLRTFLEHDYFKVRLSERELRQRTLELMALQAQMNPHFLFNTLTTIGCKSMALSGGPNDLSRMVELLSGMLGYALADPGSSVTLAEELAHAQAYFEIQRLRFGSRLRSEWAASEEAGACACVKLLLQPLVENAVEHGLGHRTGGGTVRVGASVEGGLVTVSVSDDGEGMTGARMAEIRSLIEDEAVSSDRVGLVNTIKRLRLTYAEECAYSIAPAIAASGSVSSGLRVTLRFPVRLDLRDAGIRGGSSRSSS